MIRERMHNQPQENTQIPKRRRIYLVRHGNVSYFDEFGRPVRPDTVPLNEEGRLQAHAAGELLHEVPLDLAVCSDLPRCVETGNRMLAGRAMPIRLESALREIQPGRLASIPEDEIARAFMEAFSGTTTRDSKFLGGETLGSMVDRVLPCFHQILADPSWKHLLIVAHGGVNRAILCDLLGMELPRLGLLEQDTGCINILDVDATGRGCIRLLNYTPLTPVKLGMELTTMEALYLEYKRGKDAIRVDPA